MTKTCGARRRAIPLRTLQWTETVFMPVWLGVRNSLEKESDKSFMTMQTDYGAHTCNVMLTKPN
eukprot:8025553-Heterocapsa_arctica.AAC.1